MSELVHVRALSKPFVMRGVKNTFHVLFEIQTGFLNPPDASGVPTKGAPFNLVLVLDRSGSMGGAPFTNSKLAVKKIINSMGDDDFLSLVAYDDRSRVVFFNGTRATRDTLLQKTQALNVGGCTNMMAGVDHARQILKGDYVHVPELEAPSSSSYSYGGSQSRVVYVTRPQELSSQVFDEIQRFDRSTLTGGKFGEGGEYMSGEVTVEEIAGGPVVAAVVPAVAVADPVAVADADPVVDVPEGEEEGETKDEEEDEPEEEEEEEEEEGEEEPIVVPANANRRIFLFTDGLVNAGVQDKDQIYQIIRSLHDEDQINVTSFGLGASFDEELMMNIAENGRGDYFFISGADDIDPKVQKGMSVLQTLIGKNSKLKIEGVNGATIKKVYGFEDSDLGSIPVGDLCEDDVRTVLVEVEMLLSSSSSDASDEDADPFRCLTFEYSFEGIEDGAEAVTLAGDCCVAATEDGDKVMVESDAVRVARVIAHSSENDMEIVRLLDQRQVAQAVALKEKTIAELVSVEKVDTTGIVHLILVKARKTLKKLKNPAQIQIIKKEVRYSSYQSSIVHRKCF